MTTRRERAKVQKTQQDSITTVAVANTGKEHPIAKKMGDFFIDVAKLVIGGVILAGLMKQDIVYALLALCALGAVSAFVGLGIYLIKVSNR
ncbi:MAG: hypothetical protein IJV25_04550 [Prevotella sp.]|nr:hypothetical protein [Prevotella sp.]